MFEVFIDAWANMNNYIFGSVGYTLLAFMFFISVLFIYKGMDISAILVLTFMGLIVGGVWFAPTWLITTVAIVIGVVISWALVKFFGGI